MSSSSQPFLGPPVSDGTLVRRLLLLSWRYRSQCVKILVFQFLLLALGLAGLGLTGLAIDCIRHQVQPGTQPPHWPFGFQPPESWSAITSAAVIAGVILLLAIISGGLNYLYTVATARLVHRDVVAHLRSLVYDKLQRLSFRFFDANASGTIINRVTGDVQSTRAFIDGVILQGVILFLSLAIYLSYMLSIHVMLTVVCLTTAPLFWIASSTFSRLARPAYKQNRELVDHMVLVLSESVQGIHTVKGFAREREELARFQSANDAVTNQQWSLFRNASIFSPTIALLTHINLIILLGYGGSLVIRGELPLGTGLIVFVGLLQQFSGQISNIAAIANTLQQSLIGARRVYEVLDAPVEIQSPPNAVRLAKVRGAVRFDHVWFEYKETETVLQDVDFETQPGQCVAILGATGSGKSALMSLIPRFYDPLRGRVMIDGIDLREMDLDDLRRHIGLVFQESFLFSNTVAANIAFGYPQATREQVERASQIASAHEFITRLPKGYDTVLGEGGVTLSGGQRQRLAFARAMLLEPSILLLDDPTAAIDSQTEHEIFEAMEKAIVGRTTFIVAHRLSTLRRADMIIVLDKGMIVQQGTHEDLMNVKGPYRRVAMLQLVDAESVRLLEGGPLASPKPTA